MIQRGTLDSPRELVEQPAEPRGAVLNPPRRREEGQLRLKTDPQQHGEEFDREPTVRSWETHPAYGPCWSKVNRGETSGQLR